MKLFKKGQGATEYLLMLAAVLVIVAIAIYYVTSTGGYPPISAAFKTDSTQDNIQIEVYSGSIPAGEWEYRLSKTSGAGTWQTGPTALGAGTINLENKAGDTGTWYCNLRHRATGHQYFTNDQAVTVA